uniref:Uncharacterized protein n=1 Tax=Geladintestivirus 1 TaxID=3233133 RepID=A0AAU8MI15_9CAUD
MCEIDNYIVDIDYEVLSQDIDDVDFYAEREVKNDSNDSLSNNIKFE